MKHTAFKNISAKLNKKPMSPYTMNNETECIRKYIKLLMPFHANY